jgi:hypothetical protein
MLSGDGYTMFWGDVSLPSNNGATSARRPTRIDVNSYYQRVQ